MNTEEQRLIDGLFGRIRQAEDPAQPRDAQAQACIEAHLRQQPAAPYYMAQAILVQEAALKRLDEQNKQLQAELQQAKAEPRDSSNAGGGGGFLSSLFGANNRQAAPSAPAQAPARPVTSAPNGGGWRDGPQSAAPAAAQAAPAAAPARGAAGSFLGGAMQTAAGVAGGVLLAQGISSLFNHGSQPQEVVEVIEEAPAPASEQGGWHDQAGQQQVADNADYGNGQGGFADTDYGNDDGGFFSDDDSFI
ncbi:DUF2076 domain-containing protein [Pseudomonas cremoricolorata]|uniref:ABC transporter substrate-binding protein n=1 Tax=Pseudomonas cremoricolorata TaxID=157783 RepID=A0A089WP59_9PSED|nr:DUF2076 domain-containing protein [Pseudomonas cremoricolorata]AIR88257.1 ABC transporter substrate-binding protein [Pseudomonas cremoricolorata]